MQLGVDKATGEKLAIKIIDKKKFAKNTGLRKNQLEDEVNVMKALRHPHILTIRNFIETEDKMFLILEL